MENYAIVVDSTTDLTPELAQEWGLEVIPYIFTLEGKDYHNYLDYRELSSKDFYAKLRESKPVTTTQVTTFRYMEVWEPFLKEGKDILYMCLSSGLSKSYDQSVMAAKQAMEEYPGRKVIAIDSKSASLGQGMLAYHASKARAAGMSLEDNAKMLEEIIPNLHIWFVPDDLFHLKRSGRVSGASALLGSVLSIKPILHVLADGRIVPVSKVRGWGKVFDYLLARMEEHCFSAVSEEFGAVYIAHSDSPERALQFQDAVMKKFGAKDFMIVDIGPVIGAHTGYGSLAVAFMGSARAVVKE